MKLLRVLAKYRGSPLLVPCLAPIALHRLHDEGVYSWRDWLALFKSGFRQVINPRTDHPLEELVALSRALDRAEQPWWRRWLARR